MNRGVRWLPENPVFQVGDARRIDGPNLLQGEVCGAEVVEEARTGSKRQGNNGEIHIVDHPGGKTLLGRAKAQSCSRIPPSPSGFSMLWSGPAT